MVSHSKLFPFKPCLTPVQQRVKKYGPEILKTSDNLSWTVNYNWPTWKEVAYEDTTHSLDGYVFATLLQGGGIDLPTMEAAKAAHRAAGTEGVVARFTGNMHAWSQTRKTCDKIQCLEICSYHVRTEVKIIWPTLKFTTAEEMMEHKEKWKRHRKFEVRDKQTKRDRMEKTMKTALAKRTVELENAKKQVKAGDESMKIMEKKMEEMSIHLEDTNAKNTEIDRLNAIIKSMQEDQKKEKEALAQENNAFKQNIDENLGLQKIISELRVEIEKSAAENRRLNSIISHFEKEKSEATAQEKKVLKDNLDTANSELQRAQGDFTENTNLEAVIERLNQKDKDNKKLISKLQIEAGKSAVEKNRLTATISQLQDEKKKETEGPAQEKNNFQGGLDQEKNDLKKKVEQLEIQRFFQTLEVTELRRVMLVQLFVINELAPRPQVPTIGPMFMTWNQLPPMMRLVLGNLLFTPTNPVVPVVPAPAEVKEDEAMEVDE